MLGRGAEGGTARLKIAGSRADNLHMRTLLSTCVIVAVLCGARADAQFNVPTIVPGEDYRVELGLALWTPSPEIVLRTDEVAAIGSEVDFVTDFGLEDERFREFRLTLKPGRKHKLRLQYVPIKYDADATLTRQITFGGRTFNVGIPATASLDWKLWRFGYEWDIVSREAGFFGIIGEVKYNQVSAEVSSPIIGVEAYDATAPVPALGVIGRGYLTEYASITAEFTGFKLPDSISEEFEAEFWDFDIYGTINFTRNAGAQLGYRSMDVEYIVDEDAGRMKLKGLYFGGVVRF
jgi:hypothetical protein